jgi:hypothetical protein
MDRHAPRHLSRYPAGPSLRGPLANVLAVAVAGLVLVAVLVATELDARIGLGPAGRRSPPNGTVWSVPTGRAEAPVGAFELPRASRPVPDTKPGSSSLLPDPSFESGLAGWRAGEATVLDRVGSARDGRWAANFSATSTAGPSVVAPKVAVIKGKVMYVVTLWLRSSRPGTAVTVTLDELRRGRSFAVDTVGAVLHGVAWQRLEIAHEGHEAGNTLALEVSAPELHAPASVSLDLVDVRVERHTSASGAG